MLKYKTGVNLIMAEELARDPVCSMMVKPSSAAIQVDFKNKTYYFCHQSCATKFKKSPELFLDDSLKSLRTKHLMKAPIPVGKANRYSCPMDPEIIKDAPGDCPKCGMPLDPMSPDHFDKSSGNLQLVKIVLAVFIWMPLLSSHFFDIHTQAFLSLQALLSTLVVFGFGLSILKSFFKSLWPGPWNMFTLVGLGVLASHSLSLLTLFKPELFGHHSYFESSAGIIVLMMVGQYLENKLHKQANHALAQMAKSIPQEARFVGPNGEEKNIPTDLIQTGDLVRVLPGEKVPIDGIISQGISSIDEAMITGEPFPREVNPNDNVFAGTLNIQGSFTLTATGSGRETVAAKIIQLVEEARRSRLPIQAKVDFISRIMIPLVLLIAIATFGLWILINKEPQGWIDALRKSIAVLVIACPCALGLATPMALGVGISRGARLGILVRSGESLENLINIDVLVIDKTGTLTEGKPRVEGILTSPDRTGTEFLMLTASLAQGSAHPLCKSIVSYALDQKMLLTAPTETVEVAGKGAFGIIAGARVILGKLSFLEEKGIDTSNSSSFLFNSQKPSSTVWVANSNKLAGCIWLADSLKASTTDAIKQLQKDGIQIILMSGDNEQSTSSTAKQLNIKEYYGDQTPEDKVLLINKLLKNGKMVAMAGDGANDAPALAKASVSIAMGTGTDLAQENSGLILLKGDLLTIVAARKLSYFTILAIRQNLALAFLYNLLCIPLAAFGYLSPILAGFAMSLSSVSVLLNSLRLRNKPL